MTTGKWLTPETLPTAITCRRLSIPDDPQFLAVILGALLDMSYPHAWEQTTGITPEDAADAFRTLYNEARKEFPCMIGAIIPYATAATPTGTLACDGASFLRSDYPALYDALDTSYHVDATHGRTPDLRGRSIVGVGQGSGLSNRAIDGSGGEETHTLSIGEMPSHAHSFNQYQFLPVAAVGVVGAASAPTFPTNTGSAGSGGAHENMHPWRALRYCIVAV